MSADELEEAAIRVQEKRVDALLFAAVGLMFAAAYLFVSLGIV